MMMSPMLIPTRTCAILGQCGLRSAGQTLEYRAGTA
jgi:hypothetical protein